MRNLTVKPQLFALGALALGLTACATIMQSTYQGISVSSSPSGAEVTIDSRSYGRTPTVAQLARKTNHLVKIELPGYLPFEMYLTRRVSGWAWGNIVFGGLIGLAIDAISGGLYKLTPDQVAATLAKNQGTLHKQKDVIYIVTTLKPEPSWEKVGTFHRASP